jgi:hypothetical protein
MVCPSKLRSTVPHRLRPEEAIDRTSGGPDPPVFGPSPRLRGAKNQRRRAALAGAGRPSGVSRVLRGSGAESSALSVRRSRQAVSAAFRCSLPLRGPKAVASGLASLNLARPGRRTPKVRRRSVEIGSTLSGSIPFSVQRAADSVFAGLPHPPPSALGVSHALGGLHPATPSGLVSSR